MPGTGATILTRSTTARAARMRSRTSFSSDDTTRQDRVEQELGGVDGVVRTALAVEVRDERGNVLGVFRGSAEIVQVVPVRRHIRNGDADAIPGEPCGARGEKALALRRAIRIDADGAGAALQQDRAGDGMLRLGVEEAQRHARTRGDFTHLDLGLAGKRPQNKHEQQSWINFHGVPRRVRNRPGFGGTS